MNPNDKFVDLVSLHFPDAEIQSVSPLTGGVSADATLIDIENVDRSQIRLVLREHGSNHNGHGAALEYQLLDSLHALGFAVPKPFGFGDGEGVENGVSQLPYVVLEYIEGSTTIPSSEIEARITIAAEKLVAIHEVATVSLPELPPRFDPVPELLDFLPDDAEWEGLRSLLSQMRSAALSGKGVLLHGDFWPANIVWNDGQIVGVIDWEDAAIGDPLSDVACACLEFRYAYGDWGSECFLNAYSARRHVDPFRLALWQAYVAAAGNCSMDDWGLDPSKVQAMRAVALKSIREAHQVLTSSNTASG
ncbi:MAG: phosphotransferase [Erythrobacter sp.]